jgi:hypothetical protein
MRDPVFEDGGAMPQMVGGVADVGAHRMPLQPLRIIGQLGFQQGFDGRADAVHHGTQVGGTPLGRQFQLIQRGRDGATVGMAQHHHQPRAEALDGKLDAADLRRRHDVASHADDEQLAQPLIEDQLGRHAGICTAQQHGKGGLLHDELAAARLVGGQ